MQIPAGILLPKINYTKPALSYDEQLDTKLIPRGLIVEDRERAISWLRRVGYYRLSGYLYPYRVSPIDDNFRPGSTFDTAVYLYKFDGHLRLLLLQALDRIEIAIRASVTYHLGHQLGPFGHMESTNFKPPAAATAIHGFEFAEFAKKIKGSEKQSNEVFITHYRDKYANPELPIWMVTEIIPFGTLSRMTESLRDKQLPRKIARDFGLSQSQLISWLKCLTYVRNVCAHHGRLWNRTLSVKPELLPSWKRQAVTRDRLYVVLLMMIHLLSESAPRCEWKSRVSQHLLSSVPVDLHPMGFPPDWYRSALWDLCRLPG